MISSWRIRAMEVPGASRDVWISQASYLELQSLSRVTPKTVVLLWGQSLDKLKANSLNITKSNHIML